MTPIALLWIVCGTLALLGFACLVGAGIAFWASRQDRE